MACSHSSPTEHHHHIPSECHKLMQRVPGYDSTSQSKLKSSTHINITTTTTTDTGGDLPTSLSSALPDGVSSMTGVYYNFMNSLVGGGILGLTFVYPAAGLLGGILLQVIFATLSVYTLFIVIRAAQTVQVHDYEQLGFACFGNIGYFFVCLCLFLQDFGTMLNFLIVIGDSGAKIIQIWGYDTLEYRQFVLLFLGFVVILPPCLLRDIAFYERASFVKLVTVVFVIGLICYEYVCYRVALHDTVTAAAAAPEFTWFQLSGFPRAVGIVAYTFEVHDAAFLYYNTLYNPTLSRWTFLCVIALVSALGLGLWLSIPAYFMFGDAVSSNVLNSFDIHSTSIIIARIVYAVTMALSYPTSFFVVRHVLYMTYQKIVFSVQEYRHRQRWKRKQRVRQKQMMTHHAAAHATCNKHESECISPLARATFEESSFTIKTSPPLHHGLFSVGLFCANLCLAMYVQDLGIALNLVGSIASMNLIFILPALFWWKCCNFDWQFWRYKTRQQQLNAFLSVYGSILVACVGAAVAVLGVSSVFVTK